MNAESTALMILSDKETAASLVALLREQGLDPQSSGRRNLDGSIAVSWVVLASVGLRTAPAVLRALSEFLMRDRVHRIEFSGLTIDNPRPEDVDRIIQGLPSGENGPSK